MSFKKSATVADVEGPWLEPNFVSDLIQRCKLHWNTPVSELTNELLATFLRQEIALSLLIPEAKKRVAANFIDDSELYEEELAVALSTAEKGK